MWNVTVQEHNGPTYKGQICNYIIIIYIFYNHKLMIWHLFDCYIHSYSSIYIIYGMTCVAMSENVYNDGSIGQRLISKI